MASQAEMSDLNKQMIMAEIRKELADAFKSITQGQKNAAAADAATTNTALDILTRGLEPLNGPEGKTGTSQ
jgi:hypothetical protein